MRAKGKKHDLSTKLFIAAAAFLCLILIGEGILFLNRIRPRDRYYTVEANTILHELNRGSYTEALYSVQSNRAAGITEKDDPDFALAYAAADYYEAASYYAAYDRNSQEDLASKYREKMEEAYQRMGELQFLAEKMNAELGLEE